MSRVSLARYPLAPASQTYSTDWLTKQSRVPGSHDLLQHVPTWHEPVGIFDMGRDTRYTP